MSEHPPPPSAAELPQLASAPEAQRLRVGDILERAAQGQLRVPEFQRGLRWKGAQVVELFDSILRGYPVGVLLFAKRDEPAARVSLGPVEFDAPAVRDTWLIVDGQQRVTSLVGALKHPKECPRRDAFAVWFDLENRKFERLSNGPPPPTWVPLNKLGDLVDLGEWLETWPLRLERQDLKRVARDVQKKILQFEIPAYVVTGADQSTLRQIFKRVNTSGTQMNEEEVFAALFPNAKAQPFAAACRRLDTATGFGVITRNLLLRCIKAVVGLDPKVSLTELEHEPKLQGDALARTEAALRRAIAFLQDDASLPHASIVPYLSPPLIVLARYFAVHPKPSPRARTLLRMWVWRSALSREHAQSSQGLIRSLAKHVVEGEPELSAHRLVRAVQSRVQLPSAELAWNTRQAEIKACMAALLARFPQETLEASMAEVAASDDDDEQATEAPTFLNHAGGEPRSIAEAFVARDRRRPDLLTATREVLDAHLVSDAALEALREHDEQRFLANRSAALAAWLIQFFRERTGESESDRPSIHALEERVESRFP